MTIYSSTDQSSEEVDLTAILNTATLVTRDRGAEIRQILLGRLDSIDSMIIDLAAADAISPSFADELFAGIENALGIDAFRRRVRIHCPRTDWRLLIRNVLAHRRMASV